jgi:hypothetical protein
MPTILAVEERSKRVWTFHPENPFWQTLEANVRDFGHDRVVAAMDEWVTLNSLRHPNAQQLVAGADRVLHPLSASGNAATRAADEIDRRTKATAKYLASLDLPPDEEQPPAPAPWLKPQPTSGGATPHRPLHDRRGIAGPTGYGFRSPQVKESRDE